VGGVPIGAERPSARDSRLRVSWVGTPTGQQRDAIEFFRCRACGEVIGVYEPLIVHERNGTRTTARAAEPDLKASGSTHYHRDCYVSAAHGDPRATQLNGS
jgi:hypothetical protein